MPQLIAMIIVVVGAMIYMFQTFGGTGDKIEGVAQKSSIITEINNIKDGLKLAAKSGQLGTKTDGDYKNTLQGLGQLSYFAEQINEQLKLADTSTPTGGVANANTYNAISFGGEANQDDAAMKLSLVTPSKVGDVERVPGIFVDFSRGKLKDNAAFLESQVANDLATVAYIDRGATNNTAKGGVIKSDGTSIEQRTPNIGAGSTDPDTGVFTADTNGLSQTLQGDGKFIIYFKDFGPSEVVIDNN